MGISDENEIFMSKSLTLKPFTTEDLLNRELIIKMLRDEDEIILGEEGKKIYTNPTYFVTKSLFSEYVIHRMVLTKNGFDTSDQSVENYRKIFKTYYKSPTDYDEEVLKSVAYMRENRCVYYTSPIIKVGQTLPNCRLYELNGVTETNIVDSLGKFDLAFVAAFSDS